MATVPSCHEPVLQSMSGRELRSLDARLDDFLRVTDRHLRTATHLLRDTTAHQGAIADHPANDFMKSTEHDVGDSGTLALVHDRSAPIDCIDLTGLAMAYPARWVTGKSVYSIFLAINYRNFLTSGFPIGHLPDLL